MGQHRPAARFRIVLFGDFFTGSGAGDSVITAIETGSVRSRGPRLLDARVRGHDRTDKIPCCSSSGSAIPVRATPATDTIIFTVPSACDLVQRVAMGCVIEIPDTSAFPTIF